MGTWTNMDRIYKIKLADGLENGSVKILSNWYKLSFDISSPILRHGNGISFHNIKHWVKELVNKQNLGADTCISTWKLHKIGLTSEGLDLIVENNQRKIKVANWRIRKTKISFLSLKISSPPATSQQMLARKRELISALIMQIANCRYLLISYPFLFANSK